MKALVAAGLIAVTPLTAMAEGSTSVLFGSVNVGVSWLDTGVPGQGSVTALDKNGGRIGFRGTEQLWGDLSVGWWFEGSFEPDTGGKPTAGFNRRSRVGLESKRYGSLYLGRDFSPTFYVLCYTDPWCLTYYGNTSQVAMRNIRVSNSIFWTSPTLSGFQVRATYGFGERTVSPPTITSSSAGDFLGASVTYRNGGLLLSTGINTLKDNFGGTNRDMAVGARYTTGGFSVMGGYFVRDDETNGAPGNSFDKTRATYLGAKYVRDVHTFSGVAMVVDQEGPASANGIGLLYQYRISKRTSLYGNIARMSNNEASNWPLANGWGCLGGLCGGGVAGADPSAVALGIVHQF